MKSIITAVAASAVPSLLADGCAASAPTVHVLMANGKAIVPLAQLPEIGQPHAYAKVFVDQYANPIILFGSASGEMRAVLSTCSHSGCEVKKLRTKFECPCHGSEYDLEGKVLRGPAPDALDTFRVQQFPDRIEILMG